MAKFCSHGTILDVSISQNPVFLEFSGYNPDLPPCWRSFYFVICFHLVGQIDNLLVRETDAITVKCFYSADCLRFKCTKITRTTSRSTLQSHSQGPSNNFHILHHDEPASNSFTHTSRHANVLVEPIEQTCTYLNGNFGEIDFGCSDVDRARHPSSDSVGRDSHTENQCLEIIASVMNGEPPPRVSHRESPPLILNTNSQLTCSYLNGNLEPSSSTFQSEAIFRPRSVHFVPKFKQ